MLESILLAYAVALAVPSAYLALLSILALPAQRSVVRLRRLPTFAVLIPAHNEERTIGALLASLRRTCYPCDRWRAFVLADACSDGTAAVARRCGATVFERPDGGRGKGPALAWLLERVQETGVSYDAILFIDADCTVSPNLFAALAARLEQGAQALQTDYRMEAAGGPSAHLREVAFALHSTIRSLGRSRLGASCPLLGSGMCFSRELLARRGWTSFGLCEDREEGLRLLLAGVAVQFVPEARVTSAVPPTLGAARSQHLRWERGRLRLAGWLPRLLTTALRRRDPRLLDAALDALTPPLAVLAALELAALGSALAFGFWPAVLVAGAALAALGGHVLVGMAALRAAPSAYGSLALAPAYALWKLALYLQALLTPGSHRWVRTARSQGSSDPAST